MTDLEREWRKSQIKEEISKAQEANDYTKYRRLLDSCFDKYKDLADFWTDNAWDCHLGFMRNQKNEEVWHEEAHRLYDEGEIHLIKLGDTEELADFYGRGKHSLLLRECFKKAERYLDAYSDCRLILKREMCESDKATAADICFRVGRYDEAISYCDFLIEHHADSNRNADLLKELAYEAMRMRAYRLREDQEAKILLGAPLHLITAEKPPVQAKQEPDKQYGEWEFADRRLQSALYNMRTRRDLTARQQKALRDVYAAKLKNRRTISFAKARNLFAKAFHPNQTDAEILAILNTSERQDAWMRLNYYMGFSKQSHPVENYRMSA
ncbi:hypothetical protein VWY06_01975 [Phaeobacter sp. JH20_10]|uniref:hypothetical protein n=1 Tax=Phaeobacter sp. JH20_10 TaxID=3112469 RepID=UPI003A8BDB5C